MRRRRAYKIGKTKFSKSGKNASHDIDDRSNEGVAMLARGRVLLLIDQGL